MSPGPGQPRPVPPWAADLVGLEAEVALGRVRENGVEPRVTWTRPPWPGEGLGAARVIRVRIAGDAVLELTLAREGYRRRDRLGGEDRAGA